MSAPTIMARQAEFKRVKESKRERILIKTTINKHKVIKYTGLIYRYILNIGFGEAARTVYFCWGMT